MRLDIEEKSKKVLDRLLSNPRLSRFVNCNLSVPEVHQGTGEIKLIILGQDPTVKNARERAKITKVLNLNWSGALRIYLSKICTGLGIDLDKNVYATNYFKNFFIAPPTQIHEIDIFKEFSPTWLPLFLEEIAQFPRVPVLSLGEPLLGTIVKGEAVPCVRHYWGYTSNWRLGEIGMLHYLQPEENVLCRIIFPFPHQPSINKLFYRTHFERYAAFVKEIINGLQGISNK
jgi:hypothetical protein